MKIADHHIGVEHRPLVIAEIAQAHDGSLGNALAYIDIAQRCGADAIKFQTHIAEEESTASEPWRIPFSRQDASRFEYWKRTGFSFEQWKILKNHADEVGITFLSSPFSLKACDWLEELEIPAWKLASGEVHNRQLVERISIGNKPIIMSSGLSTLDQTIGLAHELIGRGCEVAVLHCTTQYPTKAAQVGMNIMTQLARELNAPVGLSDHSGTIYPGVIAAFEGASIIEVHLALHKAMFGPDTAASLTPDQLRALVEGVAFAHEMRTNSVEKDVQLGVLAKERAIFSRSLVAARDIKKGAILQERDLFYKKPGGGLSYEERGRLVGREVLADLKKDQIVKEEDVG
jgi:N-acetylneuraminate synthase